MVVKDFFKKKMYKNPLYLGLTGLILIVLISAGVALIFNIYLHKPTSKNKNEVDFVIESGEGVRSIAERLEENHLIRNDLFFLVYLKISGNADEIMAGRYKLSTNNSPLEVVDILTKGKVASRKIIIPEGWTNLKIAQYLNDKGVVKKEDFLAATKEKYDYDFLPKGVTSVEGFLFPDTYQIPYGADSEFIINAMLENFDRKVDKQLREEIKATNLDLFETIILASIVEREVSKPEDRKTVAGIFLTRLKEGMKLQSDVTVNYVLNSTKKVLDYNDIAINSPYNTYIVPGLPVGPIANPGIDSIRAVVHPSISEFKYFLAADGVTYYAKTLNEHEINKNKYLK